jgi:hypothetical protein
VSDLTDLSREHLLRRADATNDAGDSLDFATAASTREFARNRESPVKCPEVPQHFLLRVLDFCGANHPIEWWALTNRASFMQGADARGSHAAQKVNFGPE